MVEQVSSFLQQDFKDIANNFSDFNEAKQSVLRNVMSQCAKDTEFPLAKPYDLEHENLRYFSLCLRNGVVMHPALNNSKGVKSSILGWSF